MRVLQVTSDTDARGGPVFARDLHRPLAERGLTVRTVALAPGAVGGLDLRTLGPTRRHPRTIARLRRLMASADVVIAHGSTTGPACALAGAGVSTPFVYRNLGDPLAWATTPARRARTAAFLSRAAAVAALWPGAAEALHRHLGVPRGRITTIPIAADPDRLQPATPDQRTALRRDLGLDPARPVIAFVGSLTEEKRVHLALDAIGDRPVPAGIEGAHLLVAGDGPLRAALEDRARRQRAPVTFLGRVTDPAAIYHAADVLVLPSRTEGMPAVLVEAGLCGVPSVATNVGGVGEIVTDTTGSLVAPDATAADLAQALATVVDRRDALGAAARRRCRERFALDAIADRWAGLLDWTAGR